MSLLLLGMWLAMLGLQGGGAASPNQAIINGRATNSTGAEGVPDVQVLLVGPLTGSAANAATSNPLMIQEIAEGSATPQARVITDRDGRFTFRNLASGQYMLRLQKEGYFDAVPTVSGALSTIITAPLTVTDAVTANDIRIAMMRAATISGKIRDGNGSPAANALVLTYQLGYHDGRPALMEARSSRADDRGEYRLFGHPPGEYYLAVAQAGPARSTIGILRGPDPCCKTYYPGLHDVRSATPIKVFEGDEIYGLDIDIRPLETFKVSGRYTSTLSAPNAPIRQPTFAVYSNDPEALWDNTNYYSSVSMAPDGSFELQGVPAGSYDLVVTAPEGNGRNPGRVRIDVKNRDLEGVTISTRPGNEVKFRVLVDGRLVPPSQAGGRMGVSLRSRDSYSYATLSGIALRTNAIPDETGTYVIPNVPEGDYSIVVGAIPANSYIADIRDGGLSVYDSGITVRDRALGPIDILLSSGAQSIRGTVRDSEGKPVGSSTVVLVPPPARRQNPLLYRTIRTNANGEFALNIVPPGDYKIFAWRSLPNTAYMNAAFMARHEARGRTVQIVAGGTRNFDLTVIPTEPGR